jgi:hypothetical protein
MVLHVLHNGLMLSLIYFGPRLQAWGWDSEAESYLPLPLLLTTTAVAVVTAILVALATHGRQSPQTAPA